MSKFYYKIIFKGTAEDQGKKLNLTFSNLPSTSIFRVPSSLIIELKDIMEESKLDSPQLINFQNIEEVLILGNSEPETYNYFIVILFEPKGSKKRGYLIGNLKNQGDLVIGYWPFTDDDSEFSEETIITQLEDLIQKPDLFDNIALITQ